MQERGEGSQRGRDKRHLEQARIKTTEGVNQGCQRKFPAGRSWADRVKGEVEVLGTPPHRAEHLRRAASQQQSWFGGYSQPHPWSCRALRLLALSPSHTLGWGFPTNPAVQTGPQHPQCTDTPEDLKADLQSAQCSGQEGLEGYLAWVRGHAAPPPSSGSLSISTPALRGGLSLMTEKTLKNQIMATHWGSARPEILSGSLGAVGVS